MSRKVWTRQPQIYVGLDGSSDLRSGLLLAFNGSTPLGSALQGVASPTLIGAPPVAATRPGLGRQLNGTSQAVNTNAKISSANGTAILLLDVLAVPGGSACIATQNGATDGVIGLGWQGPNFFVNNVFAAAGTLTTGLHVITGSWGANGIKTYTDGVAGGTNASTTAASANAGSFFFEIGCFNYSAGRILFTNVVPLFLGIWNRELSAKERARVEENPWQIFAPPLRRATLFAPSSGASTINPAALTFTASSLAGSATASSAITATTLTFTASTLTGSSTASSAITSAALTFTGETLVGSNASASTMTAAAMTFTASSLAGSSTASSAITSSALTFAAQSLAGASTASSAITATTLTFTGETLVGSAGGSVISAAALTFTASSLAGASTVVSTISPATLAFTGETLTGSDTQAPVAPRNTGAGRAKKRKPRKYRVEIDGEEFVVESPEEAQEILAKVRQEAEEKAETALARVNQAGRRKVTKTLYDARKTLTPPVISGPPSFERMAIDVLNDIGKRYSSALRDIEIAALLRKSEQEAEDDDEDILLLL